MIVGSRQFDLIELIEEEVLLSLPLVPKHEVCPSVHDSLLTGADGGELSPDAAPADEAPQVQEKPNPFAALAALSGGLPALTVNHKACGPNDISVCAH